MALLGGQQSEHDLRDLAHRLRHVRWIGGGTGAGKTSIATALAATQGLQPYYYDWHDARDHSERTDPSRHPAMHAWTSLSIDERWVLGTPEDMARSAIEASRERMEMVIEDLLARPSGTPIVAEGPWFFPEFIAPLLSSDRQGIWLVPTTEFRERALSDRGWVTVEGTSDGVRARSNRLQRDALLTEHVRSSAQALDLRVVEIDGTRSLAEVTALVVEHFAPALPPLAPPRSPSAGRMPCSGGRSSTHSCRSSHGARAGTACSIAWPSGTTSRHTSWVC